MCECGCGDLSPFARFAGPVGYIYALELYPSCDNGCDTPASVLVHRFTLKEAERWGILELPEVKWHDFGPEVGAAETMVPVVHPNDLRTVMEEEGEGVGTRTLKDAVRRTWNASDWNPYKNEAARG